VYGKMFHRLTFDPVNGLYDDLRLADLQLIPFPSHGLDQNRKMEYPTAEHHEFIGTVRGLHPQGKVLFQFPFQAFLDMPGGHELPVLSKEGAVIDREEHAHGRFIDGYGPQLFWIVVIGNGIPDLKSLHAHNGTDVPGDNFTNLDAPQPLEGVEFLYLG